MLARYTPPRALLAEPSPVHGRPSKGFLGGLTKSVVVCEMAKRMIVPAEAMDDIRRLLLLQPNQLDALAGLFELAESAFPLRTKFINRVAEALVVDIETARSFVVVVHFLVRKNQDAAADVSQVASEIWSDIRDYIAGKTDLVDRQPLLDAIDANRAVLESLAIPKPKRNRATKVRRLSSGPERTIESVRTVCQLRPLFEATDSIEGNQPTEDIAGLVPSLLLELQVREPDGTAQILVFGMSPETLTELEKVIQRTQRKLATIESRFQNDILSTE